ncbi:prepilin-type N-terminal cleavage/methylation domain-containing protein [bacterium]|nr:prepilin-type N-terminal cleavage/methylation domain-containing protein [bacterium]
MGVKTPSQKGITLVELLMSITIIAIGIFPLLAAFSNVVGATITQKDQISAITLAKFQMDLFLNQFQLIDNLSSTYPNEFTIVSPAPGIDDDGEFKESLYNETLFRILTTFEKDLDLSTNTQVTYKVSLAVWKIQNPPDDEFFPLDLSAMSTPSFNRGDELIIELQSLYSQKNILID